MVYNLNKNKPAGRITVYTNIIPKEYNGKMYWFEKFTKIEKLEKEFFGNSYSYVTILDCPQEIFHEEERTLDECELRWIKSRIKNI